MKELTYTRQCDLLLAQIGKVLCEYADINMDIRENEAQLTICGYELAKTCLVSGKDTRLLKVFLNNIMDNVVPIMLAYHIMNTKDVTFSRPIKTGTLLISEPLLSGTRLHIRLFRNVTEELLEKEKFTIRDFGCYQKDFVYIQMARRTFSQESYKSCRLVDSYMNQYFDQFPVLFEAGYADEYQYVYADEYKEFYNVPETLRDYYLKMHDAIDINSVIGNCEESIAMCMHYNKITNAKLRELLKI